MATPPPIKAATRMPPKAVAPSPQATPVSNKTFSVSPWDGAGEGQKVVIYAGSGKGKTTLASMAPKPVFIGLDDGGRMIRNPITGQAIDHISGIETFRDVRAALAQRDLFVPYKSVVIDTGTALEILAIQHVIETIPHEKPSTKIEHIDDYGYGKGYNHLFDTMRLFFADCDGLIRQGKNVIILCQKCSIVIANASGANYQEDGPELYHPGVDSKQRFSIRGFAISWADHVLRIDYLKQQVIGARTEERQGKVKEHAGKVVGDTERVVYTMPTDPSYFAKTRTLAEPLVSFETQADDSIWKMLFPNEYQ